MPAPLLSASVKITPNQLLFSRSRDFRCHIKLKNLTESDIWFHHFPHNKLTVIYLNNGWIPPGEQLQVIFDTSEMPPNINFPSTMKIGWLTIDRYCLPIKIPVKFIENSQDMPVLECEICNEEYNEYDVIPRIIPVCGHTLCENCADISIQINGNNQIVCPECRQTADIQGGAANLPRNFAILRFLRDQNELAPEVKLAIPEFVAPRIRCFENPRHESNVFCCVCNAEYCQKCFDTVHSGKAVSNHATFPAVFPKCEKHPDREAVSVCQDATCFIDQTQVCGECFRNDHKGHEHESILKNLENKKEALNVILVILNSKEQEIRKKLKSGESRVGEYRKEMNKDLKTINSLKGNVKLALKSKGFFFLTDELAVEATKLCFKEYGSDSTDVQSSSEQTASEESESPTSEAHPDSTLSSSQHPVLHDISSDQIEGSEVSTVSSQSLIRISTEPNDAALAGVTEPINSERPTMLESQELIPQEDTSTQEPVAQVETASNISLPAELVVEKSLENLAKHAQHENPFNVPEEVTNSSETSDPASEAQVEIKSSESTAEIAIRDEPEEQSVSPQSAPEDSTAGNSDGQLNQSFPGLSAPSIGSDQLDTCNTIVDTNPEVTAELQNIALIEKRITTSDNSLETSSPIVEEAGVSIILNDAQLDLSVEQDFSNSPEAVVTTGPATEADNRIQPAQIEHQSSVTTSTTTEISDNQLVQSCMQQTTPADETPDEDEFNYDAIRARFSNPRPQHFIATPISKKRSSPPIVQHNQLDASTVSSNTNDKQFTGDVSIASIVDKKKIFERLDDEQGAPSTSETTRRSRVLPSEALVKNLKKLTQPDQSPESSNPDPKSQLEQNCTQQSTSADQTSAEDEFNYHSIVARFESSKQPIFTTKKPKCNVSTPVAPSSENASEESSLPALGTNNVDVSQSEVSGEEQNTRELSGTIETAEPLAEVEEPAQIEIQSEVSKSTISSEIPNGISENQADSTSTEQSLTGFECTSEVSSLSNPGKNDINDADVSHTEVVDDEQNAQKTSEFPVVGKTGMANKCQSNCPVPSELLQSPADVTSKDQLGQTGKQQPASNQSPLSNCKILTPVVQSDESDTSSNSDNTNAKEPHEYVNIVVSKKKNSEKGLMDPQNINSLDCE